MPDFDWSVLNTALMLAAIGYLYRQARIVDQVRQVLIGYEGHGGVMAEVKLLRERTHELSNSMGTLSGTVEELTRTMEQRAMRRDPS